MKGLGAATGDYHRMQVWAGQSAAMAELIPPLHWLTSIGKKLEGFCRHRAEW